MEEAYIDKEQEQIRKIISFQKVASLIIRKWALVLLTVFASLAVVFSLVIVTHYAKSGHRFEAKTQLLYNPRQIARIQNMSEKQLLTVLDRISIKRKIAEKISMSQSESACLGIDLDVAQEKKPPNLFTLTAYAPTKEGAVAKVNAYAEVMIEGYIEYRNLDLENWRDSIQRRKGNIQGQISDIESEENTLKGKSGVAAPAEMLTMLTGFLTDQRRNLSRLSVQIANEEKKDAFLSEYVWDGNEDHMRIDVREIDGIKVTRYGGFRGKGFPCPFFVSIEGLDRIQETSLQPSVEERDLYFTLVINDQIRELELSYHYDGYDFGGYYKDAHERTF